MTESIWQHESCSPGRSYMLGKETYVKYDDEVAIISKIVEGLREFIHAEPAARLTLDSPKSNPERAILAIPFESDQEVILFNFAKVIYQSLMGYYISAAPRTSHFGISNLVLEGNYNSLLRREMEKLITHFQIRHDMAGRLLQNVGIQGKHSVPEAGKTFLAETIQKGLDIHVGYRIFATGESVNCSQIFLPLQTGDEIINQIYYNIERILHHNFVTYDECGEKYLNITETLIYSDLGELIKRSKNKELTRNKILNNLQFDIVSRKDPEIPQEQYIGDRLYDVLNHIQDTKLKEATDRSRDLYTACVSSTTNLIQDQLQYPKPKVRIEESTIKAEGQLPISQDYADSTGMPPARKFQRRTSGGEKVKRKKFQKITLSEEELSFGKVQVPSPPQEDMRVPSPKKERRIIRRQPDKQAR